jgi:hypothetical protein
MHDYEGGLPGALEIGKLMILRAGTVTCFGLVLRTACQGKPVEEAELPQRVEAQGIIIHHTLLVTKRALYRTLTILHDSLSRRLVCHLVIPLNGDLCYGSVKMIRFNSSNEDTKDEEPEVYGAGEEWSKPLSGGTNHR